MRHETLVLDRHRHNGSQQVGLVKDEHSPAEFVWVLPEVASITSMQSVQLAAAFVHLHIVAWHSSLHCCF
jgi:hypothetical protein